MYFYLDKIHIRVESDYHICCFRTKPIVEKEKNATFCQFSSLYRKIYELKGKAKPSQAKLKILQLKLGLEPARLGLITTRYIIRYT